MIFVKKNPSFLEKYLLHINNATKLAQNFFVNFSSIFLHPNFFSYSLYFHRQTYKHLKFWQRLRRGTVVIFKNRNLQVLMNDLHIQHATPRFPVRELQGLPPTRKSKIFPFGKTAPLAVNFASNLPVREYSTTIRRLSPKLYRSGNMIKTNWSDDGQASGQSNPLTSIFPK